MDTANTLTTIGLTEIIALIGCITGCLSLAVNLYKLWKERYCLKIRFVESECIFFDSITDKNYSTNKQALIHMIICNKSVNPLTIHDAYLKIGNHYFRFEKFTERNDLRLLQKHYPLPNNLIDPKSYAVFPMDKQFSAPLRLQTYDSFEGYGFIPSLPYDCGNKIKMSIIFKTAKRPNHKVNVVLHEFSN